MTDEEQYLTTYACGHWIDHIDSGEPGFTHELRGTPSVHAATMSVRAGATLANQPGLPVQPLRGFPHQCAGPIPQRRP
jgi:hypothetical protein